MEVFQYTHEKFHLENQMLNIHTHLHDGVMELKNIEKMKIFQRLIEL
jgi:hypothetical protein